MSGQGEPGPESNSGTAQEPSTSQQTVEMLTAAGGTTGSGTAAEPSSQPSSQQPAETPSQYSPLAAEFLKGVPADQVAVLEPYLKQWDAGVTRKFQELQSTVDPFKPVLEMGLSPVDLTNAAQIYQLLDSNPQFLYDLLKAELEGGGDQGLDGTELEPEFQLPPQVQQEFDRLTAVVEALAQRTLTADQQSQQAREDAELDSYLKGLKDQHGDFDEDYVLSKMARGMDGAEAVGKWNAMIQARLNGAGQGEGAPPVPGSNLPPVLSGGGAVPPVDSKNIGTAKDGDVKDLVAKMLSNANSQ